MTCRKISPYSHLKLNFSMKRIVLLCLFLGVLHTLKSQVPLTTNNPPQIQANGFFNVPAPTKEVMLPAVNVAALEAEDKREGTDKPFRFATSVPLSISPEKD